MAAAAYVRRQDVLEFAMLGYQFRLERVGSRWAYFQVSRNVSGLAAFHREPGALWIGKCDTFVYFGSPPEACQALRERHVGRWGK